jgi:hypothetical protein
VSALFLVTAGVQAKVILWAKPDEGALLELSLVLETRGTNDEKTTTSSVASTRPVTRGPSRLDEPSGRGWTSK